LGSSLQINKESLPTTRVVQRKKSKTGAAHPKQCTENFRKSKQFTFNFTIEQFTTQNFTATQIIKPQKSTQKKGYSPQV
jgi:hypothetical protein